LLEETLRQANRAVVQGTGLIPSLTYVQDEEGQQNEGQYNPLNYSQGDRGREDQAQEG
jgi:hypothetical protein